MISKAQIKYIRSLAQQKRRAEERAFVVEGDKMAMEWLRSDKPVKKVAATAEWLRHAEAVLAAHPGAEVLTATEADIAAMSSLTTPGEVLLVAAMPEAGEPPVLNTWYLALDEIRDPGNMGTIIRIADWFGIAHVVCSPNCADVYNPKVVQSAMGGHLRVNVYEAGLDSFLHRCGLESYAAVLDGENVHGLPRQDTGVLIIGNESRGISPQVAAAATHRITIPRRGQAESLNAGVSAGILCALLLPC